MARFWTYGHDLGGTPEANGGAFAAVARGRLGMGWSWADAPNNISTAAFTVPVNLIVAKNHGFLRGYIFLTNYPNSEHRFIGQKGSVEGTDDAWFLSVNSTGQVVGYNKGNGAKTLIGTSAITLALNQVYRINIEFQFRVAGAAILTVKIDGSLADGFTGAGFGTSNGLGHGTQLANLQRLGSASGTITEQDGGEIYLDDWVGDDAVEPGNGGIALLRPIAAGSYTDWSVQTFGWQPSAKVPQSVSFAAPANATVGVANTVRFETMASKGLGGVTIKSTRLLIYGNTPRSGWKYRLRKNGVDTDSVASGAASVSAGWFTGTIDGIKNGFGWFQDAATFPLAPADTIEGGLVDGPSGAGTADLYGVYLLVDWEGADPPAPTLGDITIEAGTYVGNGTSLAVALTDPTLAPTSLIIFGDSTATKTSVLWFSDWGDNGIGGCSVTGDLNVGVVRVDTGSFTVVGNANCPNLAGVTYRYVAIQDPRRRMIDARTLSLDANNVAIDNINLALNDSTFVPEAVIGGGPALVTLGANGFGYTDTTFGADQSVSWRADTGIPVADLLQALSVGTVQFGNKALQNNASVQVVAAFRTTHFVVRRLFAFGTYVGDASNPKVVSFAGIDGNPSLLVVMSEKSTEARWYRFFGDGLGATSRHLVNGATGTTGITDFSTPGQFTVDAALNSAATVYHYFVLGSGTDPAVKPESAITNQSTIGITWVELLDAANVLHVAAKIALPDPATYYGGYKEDRVTKWGLIQRALSDRNGQYESSDFSWEVSDTDRAYRGLLANVSTRVLLGRPITVRMISDADRRLLNTPWTVVKGIIRNYQPLGGLRFAFEAQDVFADQFNAQQDADQIPKRLITLDDFPNCPVAPSTVYPNMPVALKRPVPIIYGAITDTQIVTASGFGSLLPPVDTSLPAPTIVSQVTHAGGNLTDTATPSGRRWSRVAGYVTATNRLSPLSNLGATAPADADFQTASGVGVNFTGNAVFDSYVIFVGNAPDFDPYGRPGSASHVVYVTHDNVTVDGIVPGARFQAILDAWSGAGITPLIEPKSLATVVAELQASKDAGTLVPDYGGRIGVADAQTLQSLGGAVPSTFSGLAAIIGVADLNALLTTVAALAPQPIDAGDGQCPGIYVGDYVLSDGKSYRKFLIAGHACQSIDEIYVDNEPQAIATNATQAGAGGIWLVPGYAGWTALFGATPYEDINGRRYTVVYGQAGYAGPDKGAGILAPADNGAIPLAFSVHGIEAVGDGTGALITDTLLQYRHCLQNWIFGDYQSGVWLASPIYSDDATLAEIDDASFTVASQVAQARVSGGYAGAGIIGWSAFDGRSLAGGERITVRELVARWNQSGDVDSGFNRKGQFFVSMEQETIELLNAAVTLDDVNDILEDSLDIVDKFDEHFNDLPYQHTQDYFGRDTRGWRLVDELVDAESVATYGGRPKKAPVVSLYFVRGQNHDTDWSGYAQGTATAADIMGRRLRRTKNPPRYATFRVGMQGLNFELGDLLLVTHFAGVGVNGWVQEAFRIVRAAVDPDAFTVEITAYDIQVLYDAGFILGDETVLPASWTTATPAEQLYGFLGDEPTSAFSNGDPIKRLT